MCPDLRCHVYKINDSKFNHHDARCEPRNTVGDTLLIIFLEINTLMVTKVEVEARNGHCTLEYAQYNH